MNLQGDPRSKRGGLPLAYSRSVPPARLERAIPALGPRWLIQLAYTGARAACADPCTPASGHRAADEPHDPLAPSGASPGPRGPPRRPQRGSFHRRRTGDSDSEGPCGPYPGSNRAAHRSHVLQSPGEAPPAVLPQRRASGRKAEESNPCPRGPRFSRPVAHLCAVTFRGGEGATRTRRPRGATRFPGGRGPPAPHASPALCPRREGDLDPHALADTGV